MANATSKTTFTQIINLNKGNRDLIKLMGTLAANGISKGACQLIPTFIDIRFTEKQTDETIIPIRSFLKSLRSYQLTNFIRFISDVDTVMNSDCGDIFYTRSADTEHHKDVTFTTHILNHSHIEVRVKIHPITKTHLNIREISRITSDTLFGFKDNLSEDDICLAMIKFHRSGRFFDISNMCKDDVHVLFMPTGSYNGRRTIPIFGLSAEDAIRRSRYTDREFTNLSEAYAPFVSEAIQTQQIIQSLVNEITITSHTGPRSNSVSQVYSLAEILFGYYLRNREKEKSTPHPKNNFIWFDEIQDEDNVFIETHAVVVSKQ